jgi:hypothetical protein
VQHVRYTTIDSDPSTILVPPFFRHLARRRDVSQPYVSVEMKWSPIMWRFMVTALFLQGKRMYKSGAALI